jgi:mannosyltransferase
MDRSPSRLLASPVAVGALFLLLVAAAWFRTAHILAAPLWLDEGYSAYAAAKGFSFLWHVAPRYETHPPFYYSLLRLWTLGFGDTLGGLRSLGIVCGLLTLPMVALAAREVGRWFPQIPRITLVLGAFGLAALSPPMIEMARDVRPYPVLILVYGIAMFALLRLGRIAATESHIARGAFALYLVSAALVLWLHNLGPLYALALGIAMLAMLGYRWLSTRDWALLVGGHVLVGLVWLPALLILIDQAPTWIGSTWLQFTFHSLHWRLAVLWAAPGPVAIPAALALLALSLIWLARQAGGWRIALALLVMAVLPVTLSILISVLKTPVFIPRTMTPVAVPSLMLLAIGGMAWTGRMRWIGIGLVLLLGSQMALGEMQARRAGPMQDWYGTLNWLMARYRPGDVVWSYPNEGALPLDYAARDKGVKIIDVAIPAPVPALDQGAGAWNPTGSRGVVSLDRARLRALVRRPEIAAIPTIWLNRLGANAYDKGDVLLQELLSVGRVRVARWRSGPIDVIGLRRADLAKGAVVDEGRSRGPARMPTL